eukprot:1361497-Pleurochrysis_carterae.AAC.3
MTSVVKSRTSGSKGMHQVHSQVVCECRCPTGGDADHKVGGVVDHGAIKGAVAVGVAVDRTVSSPLEVPTMSRKPTGDSKEQVTEIARF